MRTSAMFRLIGGLVLAVALGAIPALVGSDPEVAHAAAAITIQKTPDNQTVAPGGTATFTIRVQNTGDKVFTSVTVSDPLAPDCNRNFGALGLLGVIEYSCSRPGVLASFVNVATATASYNGGSVSQSDSGAVTVGAPAAGSLDIQKMPDFQSVPFGGTATFQITVYNTGAVALNAVSVTDGQAPNCTRALGTIAAFSSSTYSCSLFGVTTGFVNQANVVAFPQGGGTLSDSDTATVSVGAGAGGSIFIDKTPASQTVGFGGTAVFTITVQNTSGQTLINVFVNDPQAPNCTRALGSLAPFQQVSFQCSLANITANFVNTATVNATIAPGGGFVSDFASASVFVGSGGTTFAGLDVEKTPDSQNVANGGVATFTIYVTNNTGTTLTGVWVSDPQASGCTKNIGFMAAGQSLSYSCTTSALYASFTNVATVIGYPVSGIAIQDSDSALVNVTSLGLVPPVLTNPATPTPARTATPTPTPAPQPAAVLGTSTLVLQKFVDPAGDRTGTTAVGGFQFIVRKDGTAIAGSPFVVGAAGLTIPGLTGGNYVVEEVIQPRWRLTGSKADLGDNGSFELSQNGPMSVALPDSGTVVRVNFYNQELAVPAGLPLPPNTGQEQIRGAFGLDPSASALAVTVVVGAALLFATSAGVARYRRR